MCNEPFRGFLYEKRIRGPQINRKIGAKYVAIRTILGKTITEPKEFIWVGPSAIPRAVESMYSNDSRSN
jgi:hypothetical protein